MALALSVVSLLALVGVGVFGFITVSDLKSDNDELRDRLAAQEEAIESVADDVSSVFADYSAALSDLEAQRIEIDDLGRRLSDVEVEVGASTAAFRVQCLVDTDERTNTAFC